MFSKMIVRGKVRYMWRERERGEREMDMDESEGERGVDGVRKREGIVNVLQKVNRMF